MKSKRCSHNFQSDQQGPRQRICVPIMRVTSKTRDQRSCCHLFPSAKLTFSSQWHSQDISIFLHEISLSLETSVQSLQFLTKKKFRMARVAFDLGASALQWITSFYLHHRGFADNEWFDLNIYIATTLTLNLTLNLTLT